MLPQHLVCKYELNCEYRNMTLASNKAPWWWSDKIETCRSVLKCFMWNYMCIRWLINWSDSTKMRGATVRFIVYIFTLLKSNFKLRFRRKCILKQRDVPHIEGTSHCVAHRMTAIIMLSIATCNYIIRSSWICQNRSVRQNNFPFSLSEGPLSCSQKFPLFFFVLFCCPEPD